MQALLCSPTLGGCGAFSSCLFNGLSSPRPRNNNHSTLPAPSPLPEQISRSCRAPGPSQTAHHMTLLCVAVHKRTPGTGARLTQQVTQQVACTDT